MDQVAEAARSALLERGICLGEWLPSPSAGPCVTAHSDLPVGTVCRKALWNLKFFGVFFSFLLNKKLDQGIPDLHTVVNERGKDKKARLVFQPCEALKKKQSHSVEREVKTKSAAKFTNSSRFFHLFISPFSQIESFKWFSFM